MYYLLVWQQGLQQERKIRAISNLCTVHAIVIYFLLDFIFELSTYKRNSMQNSRAIALELILGVVVEVGCRRLLRGVRQLHGQIRYSTMEKELWIQQALEDLETGKI
jgi:hypothetical protein